MKNQAEGFPHQRLFRLPESRRLFYEKTPFLSDLYATDLGHFPRSPGHTVERPSGSDSPILMICLEGSGWVRRGPTERIELGRRQGVLIPAGLPHAYGSHGEAGWNLYWVHFTGKRAEGFVQGLQEMEENGILHLPEPEEILRAFEEAWSAVTEAHSLAACVCGNARLALLLGTVWHSCRAGGEKARAAEARVRKSLEWMQGHATEPLSLPQIAKQASLSVPHYCALFKKQVGTSPMRHLQTLRLRKACELLDHSDAPVQSVAEACGFENPFHFSRSFKTHIGVPPKAYRKALKG